jgi:hypothetical protein
MDSKAQNEQIDAYLTATVPAIIAMDFRTFNTSISWDRYDPLIAHSWQTHVADLMERVKKAGIPPREQALLFPGTGEVRGHMFFDILLSKFADTTLEFRLKIFRFWSEMLQAICIEDPYAKEKNLIHTKDEVAEMASTLLPANRDVARKLGRAATAGYHMGHALYSDMHPSTVYENYGPYDVSSIFGPHHILAVKEFNNLRCPELWEETKSLPWNRLVITAVYENVKMKVDAITHIITEGNLVENLRFYGLAVDGKPFPIEKLPALSGALESVSMSVFERFQTFTLEEKKRFYLHVKLYSQQWLLEKVGRDWHPSQEMFDEIKDKPLYQPTYPESEAELRKLIRDVLDPRVMRTF